MKRFKIISVVIILALIALILAIVAICGIIVIKDKSTSTNEQIPVVIPKPQKIEIKTIKPQAPKTKAPVKPLTQDENGVPKSDFKVPEIG